MTIKPRHSVSALIEMHRRNKDLRTLFVEGATDRAVLRRVIGPTIPDEYVIWSVDQVEVDSPKQAEGGGNRQLVIDICRDAASRGVVTVLGLVDRNFDLNTEMGTNLIQTTTADLEFELIDKEALRPVIEVATARVMDEESLEAAISVAVKIFLIRRLGFHRGLEAYLAVPSLDTFIVVNGDTVLFDLDAFLERMDNRNRSATRWRSLHEECVGLLQEPQLTQGTMHVGFHVFEEVTEFILRRLDGFQPKSFGDDWLGKLIRAQTSPDVVSEPFFTRVLAKINNGAGAL